MFENLNGMNTDKAYKALARKGYYERMAKYINTNTRKYYLAKVRCGETVAFVMLTVDIKTDTVIKVEYTTV